MIPKEILIFILKAILSCIYSMEDTINYIVKMKRENVFMKTYIMNTI